MAPSAAAYEQQSHAAMTQSAVSRSSLDVVTKIFFESAAPGLVDLNDMYFDIVDPNSGAVGAIQRKIQPYEATMIRRLGISALGSPTAWVIAGAVREVDNPTERNPATPQDV